MTTVAETIANRRKELNLSVEDLAHILGKSRATMYRYETGKIDKLPAELILPLAVALRTTPGAILGWDEPKSLLTADEELVLKKYNSLSEEGKQRFLSGLDRAFNEYDEHKTANWSPKLTEADLRQVNKDFAEMKMASAAYMNDLEDVKDKAAFEKAVKSVMLDAKLRAKKTYTPKKYRKD